MIRWAKGQTYRARISVNGELIELGYFKSEWSAAEAYNTAAKHHFGSDGYLNRPESGGA